MNDSNLSIDPIRSQILSFANKITQHSKNPLLRVLSENEKEIIFETIKIFTKESEFTKILDVGGGKGWGEKISSLPRTDYKILDILPSIKDPRVMVGDICKTNSNLADGSFNVVFSKDTFEHLLEPWNAAQEMKRVVADRGLIIVACPFAWRFHPSPLDTYRFSHTGLQYLFERSGGFETLFTGYVRHGAIRGFWGNKKDWTFDGSDFSECWETVLVGRKYIGKNFAEGDLEGDRSTDHGGDLRSTKRPQQKKQVSLARKLSREIKRIRRKLTGSGHIAPTWKPTCLLPNSEDRQVLAHVASFTSQGSNAGDILLPAVLRDLFVSELGGSKWHSIHAHSPVDKKVIEGINKCDGLIIGGGGLFLRDTNANDISGWQWAVSSSLLSQVTVPTCVYAVGYNRFRGQPDFSDCFQKNLTTLADMASFVGLRNNGSVNAVREYLPPSLHDKVRFQPCMTTFLAKLYKDYFETPNHHSEIFIALNCAFDRADLRYQGRDKQILREIADGVKELAHALDCGIKYFSHYEADDAMLSCLEEADINYEFVSLSHKSTLEIMQAYREPLLAVGMRGHSQMIPFGCQTPILSLVSHNKLQWFLDDIGQPDWGVDLHGKLINEKIVSIGKNLNRNRPEVLKTIDDQMNRLWEISKKNIAYFQTKS